MIAGALVLGAAGYFIFSSVLKTTSPVETVSTPSSASSSVSQNTGPISVLSANQILAYSVQGGEVDAIQTTGEVVRIINGKTDTLSPSKLNNIFAASFSFDGKKVLVKYGTMQKPFFTVFDKSTLLWTGLGGQSITSADWSPTSTNEIAYLEKTDSGSRIGILNTDKLQDAKKPELGFAKTAIGSINELDSDITWLSKNEILISSKPARYVPSTILKYKVKEKTFTPVIMGTLGASVRWDKVSGLGLEYSFSNNKDTVTVIDATGALRGQMGFVAMPEKCSISQNYLYCAIPEDLKGAKLPDDYLMKAVFFKDNFYRVSLADGKTDLLLANPGGMFDARMLQVTGGKVYFLNNLDGRLYSFAVTIK